MMYSILTTVLFNKGCLPKLSPCISMTRTFMSAVPCRSAGAPTFSSTGNTKNIVSRLNPNRIASIIISSKTNRSLPPQYQVDIDQFLTASVSAVGEVTKCVSSGDWGGLEGLVDRNCINNLQASMDTMDNNQKKLAFINPGDVFLSFVANQENCDSGNNLNLVTFSLPQLEEMQNSLRKRKKLGEQFKQRIKSENITDKIQLAVLLKEYKSKISSTTSISPLATFKFNEIIIGNYRFVRDSPDTQWAITEVAQINSMQAWSTIFRIRWKGRLILSTISGKNFSTILRADYMGMFITIFIAFFMIELAGASAGQA